MQHKSGDQFKPCQKMHLTYLNFNQISIFCRQIYTIGIKMQTLIIKLGIQIDFNRVYDRIKTHQIIEDEQ